jgi:hypothetical protein
MRLELNTQEIGGARQNRVVSRGYPRWYQEIRCTAAGDTCRVRLHKVQPGQLPTIEWLPGFGWPARDTFGTSLPLCSKTVH